MFEKLKQWWVDWNSPITIKVEGGRANGNRKTPLTSQDLAEHSQSIQELAKQAGVSLGKAEKAVRELAGVGVENVAKRQYTVFRDGEYPQYLPMKVREPFGVSRHGVVVCGDFRPDYMIGNGCPARVPSKTAIEAYALFKAGENMQTVREALEITKYATRALRNGLINRDLWLEYHMYEEICVRGVSESDSPTAPRLTPDDVRLIREYGKAGYSSSEIADFIHHKVRARQIRDIVAYRSHKDVV